MAYRMARAGDMTWRHGQFPHSYPHHAERSPHISLVLLDLTKIVLSAPLGKLESIRGLACYIHHGDEKELQSVQTLLQPKGPRKATRCDSGGKKMEIGLEPCRDRKIPGRNPAI
jgi:hypothetical protein